MGSGHQVRQRGLFSGCRDGFLEGSGLNNKQDLFCSNEERAAQRSEGQMQRLERSKCGGDDGWLAVTGVLRASSSCHFSPQGGTHCMAGLLVHKLGLVEGARVLENWYAEVRSGMLGIPGHGENHDPSSFQ